MNKLDGIKPGYRVRVTYEAVVTDANSAGLSVHIDTLQGDDGTSGQAHIARITTPEAAAPTFKIERIEPPLKVGDRIYNIKAYNPYDKSGRIEAFAEIDGKSYAIVSGFCSGFGISLASDYARAPADA